MLLYILFSIQTLFHGSVNEIDLHSQASLGDVTLEGSRAQGSDTLGHTGRLLEQGGSRPEEMRCREARNHLSSGAVLFLLEVPRPLPQRTELKPSRKGSSPRSRTWREWNTVCCWGTVSMQARGTPQAAGRVPGNTRLFEVLYHTPNWHLTRVQAFMCGIPLAIVILHRWLGPIVFRARVSDS